MRRKRGTIIPALFLILLGAYLLAKELNVGIPDWDAMWPAFVVSGGLAFLANYALSERRDPDQVFFGILLTLGGVAFFFITLGPLEYTDLRTWWPVFALIASIAFLAEWLVTKLRDWGALFLAFVALVIGGAGLAINLELLGPQTREFLPRFWPLLLILGGVMALLRGLFSRRSE
jgi:hypothetical protein